MPFGIGTMTKLLHHLAVPLIVNGNIISCSCSFSNSFEWLM